MLVDPINLDQMRSMTATRWWMPSWSTITIRGCIGEDRSKEKVRAKVVENESG
jgi:hypothetical protein